MIAGEDASARAVAALDRIGEAVVDAGVDDQRRESAGTQLTLDGREERPDQTPPAIGGVDQHVVQSRASREPSGRGDRETDEAVLRDEGPHGGAARRDLPAHLGARKGARTPLLSFELEHPLAESPPRRVPPGRDGDGGVANARRR